MKNSLAHQRNLQKQEKAIELVDLWEALLFSGEAIKALGGSYPDEHIRKAQDALLRAGRIATGDLTDNVIKEIATVGNARIWAADMGQVFAGETIIDGTSGETYICTVTHQAQALYAPGTEGGRTLFRLIREEPEEPGVYLDFAWGEHVPYGAIRRDPIDNNLYTPINEAGVTLYEPHYPHLVPSEYKLYDDGTGGETTYPDFVQPTGAHDAYNMGDIINYNGILYISKIDGNVYSPVDYPDGWEPYIVVAGNHISTKQRRKNHEKNPS